MIGNKKVLALIPARGGSKGVPKKNIRLLAGKPLIAWSIDVAKQSKYIDRVIVSTDSEEIANVAKQYGAEVPFLRPKEIAQDLTPDTPVFLHCLDWLWEHENYMPDILVHLRPTGPLRTVEEVDGALGLLEHYPDADSVRSIEEPAKPPFKMWQQKGEYLVPFAEVAGMKDSHTMPRQMLPKAYQTTADIGIVRYHTIRNKNSVIGDYVLPYMLNRPTMDIDHEFDFEIAEL